jgi:HD-GYP domain-containing protein (c-di-GMP phosphodiesterase class II)
MMRVDATHQRPMTWEESLVQAFYRLLQTVLIHRDNNQLVKTCLQIFHETLLKMSPDLDLKILISEGRLFVQGERLHFRKDLVRLISAIVDFFHRRGIDGLVFHPQVRTAPFDEILNFIRLLISAVRQDNPKEWLNNTVSFPWVSIVHGAELKRKISDEDLRKKARKTYMNALASVKEVSQKITFQGNAGVRKAKRLVQNMVDSLIEDESLFLGLSTIKDYDDYTYTHSVNVAVLSLCLGNRIGLSRNSLEQLGICALFHDLGKVEIPYEVLSKPGDLTPGEWEEMQKHPLASVRQILRLNASHDLKSKIVLAPFEHHIKYDLTGYPKMHFKQRISLLGRILHIIDVYDAITSPRPYRATSLSPDKAVSVMLEGSGVDFDPVLLKVFATMLGTYPVGSLLELDTGEMGIVADYPLGSGGAKPRIILLMKKSDATLGKGDMVDLAEKDPTSGTYLRNVVRSVNPADRGIQPASFLFS